MILCFIEIIQHKPRIAIAVVWLNGAQDLCLLKSKHLVVFTGAILTSYFIEKRTFLLVNNHARVMVAAFRKCHTTHHHHHWLLQSWWHHIPYLRRMWHLCLESVRPLWWKGLRLVQWCPLPGRVHQFPWSRVCSLARHGVTKPGLTRQRAHQLQRLKWKLRPLHPWVVMMVFVDRILRETGSLQCGWIHIHVDPSFN